MIEARLQNSDTWVNCGFVSHAAAAMQLAASHSGTVTVITRDMIADDRHIMHCIRWPHIIASTAMVG
jgi:hypothetical protein